MAPDEALMPNQKPTSPPIPTSPPPQRGATLIPEDTAPVEAAKAEWWQQSAVSVRAADRW